MQDKDLIFFSYFFNIFIDDIWSNIAVDSSYREEISDEEKDLFLSGLGEKIEKLAISIQDNNFSKCHSICADMIEAYLKVIEQFERKIETHLIDSMANCAGDDIE